MSKVITLTLPWPPTSNHFHQPIKMGNFARLTTSKKARDYKKRIVEEFGGTFGKPLDTKLRLTAVFFAPTRAKRDLPNFEKAFMDGLNDAGLFEDDSLFDDIQFLRGEIIKGGCIVVRISPIPEYGPVPLDAVEDYLDSVHP